MYNRSTLTKEFRIMSPSKSKNLTPSYAVIQGLYWMYFAAIMSFSGFFLLSGGFTLGAKKADLIAAAEEKGYACDEDGDYLNIYKTADTKIDNRAQFWFNKDEDPDTVASVAYRNEILPE